MTTATTNAMYETAIMEVAKKYEEWKNILDMKPATTNEKEEIRVSRMEERAWYYVLGQMEMIAMIFNKEIYTVQDDVVNVNTKSAKVESGIVSAPVKIKVEFLEF